MPVRTRTAPPPPSVEDPFLTALEEALRFPLSRAAAAAPPPALLRERALEEAAFGRIVVDERGLTAGMRLNVIEPQRGVLVAWAGQRKEFDRLLAPEMPQVRALEKIEQEIAKHVEKRNERIEREKQKLESDTSYQQIAARHAVAKKRFDLKSAENGQRPPNLRACHWSYVIAILCIGVAEWLINYDTLFQFFEVPAIAVGATAILGLLLAFAAHGHGTLLRQWAHRFGAHRPDIDRGADRRLLGFATFSLLLVLAAAGASRYEAVARIAASQSGFNILGSEGAIAVHPVRDVLLSLLANVAAWAVGVFVAYFAHDPDPDFMEAGQEWRTVERAYARCRRRTEREIKRLFASAEKEIEAARNRTKVYAGRVEAERALLGQIDEHERAVLAAVYSVLATGAGTYRDLLLRAANESGGRLAFARADGGALTAYEYAAAPILIDPEFVHRLLPRGGLPEGTNR